MKKSATFLSLLLIVLTGNAQSVKVSCNQNGKVMELITTEKADFFKLRTIQKNGYQETSQAIQCLLDSRGNVFLGASCTQAILTIKFLKNSEGLFSILHEFVIPGKPELKDPTAGSYGDQFDCQLGN